MNAPTTMTPPAHPAAERRPEPDDQATPWNGDLGQAWVESQALLDGMLQPFEDLLIAGLPGQEGLQVLDVGCGTGSTSLAAARRLGPQGHCLGVDISARMIAVARDRALRENLPATFVCSDAQQHPFAPQSVDVVISRFGVMFFRDPVAAFRNLRQAMRPSGVLRCVAWRSPQENAFMTAAERAARPLLPQMPPRDPDGPGQFAFAREDRVRGILQESGWGDIRIEPVEAECRFAASELDHYLSRMGPLGRMLADADQGTRTRIMEGVRPAFLPYVQADQVRFNAACWLVTARAPSMS